MLPDNYQLSFRRLEGNLRGLRQQLEVMSEYDNVVREQMERGIIEEISPSKLAPTGKVHYPPHHAVLRINKQKTTCKWYTTPQHPLLVFH